MKIPKKIRIAGVDFSVIYQSPLVEESSQCYGTINYDKAEIMLDAKLQNHQGLCQTLLHEIIHGVLNAYLPTLDEHDEHLVNAVATGLYQVLQDNGNSLFDINNGTEQGEEMTHGKSTRDTKTPE